MIVCCGEALIDMVPMMGKDGEEGFVPRCGGAIFNTAIALGRLGRDVSLLTGLSRDVFGQQLVAELSRSNVNQDTLVFSDRPSTLAFVHLENGQATYSFFDENSAGRDLTTAELPAIGDGVSCMFFGGISLASGACAEAYADLAVRMSRDKVIMLDPNIRPGFIKNVEEFRTRLRLMISHTDILKVSDEDLDWILPGQDGLEQKVQEVQTLGPSLVLVTRGAEGSFAFPTKGNPIKADAVRATVVDTVGAGDTFNAGFLAKLSEFGLLNKTEIPVLDHGHIKEALDFANLAASVTVSRSGANPPWRDDLNTSD